MPKKLDTQDFIKKAKKVHSDKYDYSLVDYVNAKTKIKIICKKHGEFLQFPNKHLSGSGCPKCGIEKNADLNRKSSSEFISEANLVHNNKYDYSLVDYKNNHSKIKIICKKHGEFEQIAKDHLNGKGCPKCGIEKNADLNRKSSFQFISEANLVHNNKYDYSLVDYKNNHSKIKIICPIHGMFEQKPNVHLAGAGCFYCGISKRVKSVSCKKNEFIEKAKKVHSDFYDYSLSDYTNNKTKIKITCPIHGVFLQTPDNHLAGAGCPICGNQKKRTKMYKGQDRFIFEANLVHNNKYDYSLVSYKNGQIKVKIICPIHGEFLQKPYSHLQGHGCPNCSNSIMEIKTASFLTKHNIDFIPQKKFPGCIDKRELPFDFYIPSRNLLIECNGEQHYRSVDYFGGREQFLLQKHHDWLKRKYAKKNGINLLVIKFDENVVNALDFLV